MRDVDTWLRALLDRLDHGDGDAVEEAIAFLERDLYFFRSGYARERIARRLASVDLTADQRFRARAIVVRTLDGELHCPQPGVGRLARAVADNSLRRELRIRLTKSNPMVARRALHVLVNVRRPGLTSRELEAARAIVLSDAGRNQWLSPTTARIARYLWSREWEAELRDLLPYHGPDRAAAKRLLQTVKRRPDP